MSNANEQQLSQPTLTKQRCAPLDALRGFSLLGIMFVNFTWFTGFAVLIQTQPSLFAEHGTLELDRLVERWVTILVDSKFWSIFALLFGAGMAMQWKRMWPRLDAYRLLRRRLATLLLVGLLHGTVVWFGDIISLYAVVGFVWLLFATASTTALWRCGLFFLALPILQSAIWIVFFGQLPHGAITPPDVGHGPPELLPLFSEGTFGQMLEANWAYFLKRWVRAAYEGRFFKLLGMFLLGHWAVRADLLANSPTQRRRLFAVSLVGCIVGVPSNWFYAAHGGGVVLPMDAGEFWRSVNQCVGIPALACAYAAAFLLIYNWRPAWKIWSLLGDVGRLSLTNYILQSLIGIGLFYGCGLGLWGSVGITGSIAVIAIIFIVQSVMSRWWLYRYRYGPLEWLCRCLIYGERLTLRRQTTFNPTVALHEKS